MYNNYEIKQIATRLKYLRESLDVSVEEAAKAAQVSISEYRDAEAGKVDFTFNFLQKLAKHFGVDIIQLITGETPRLTGFQVTRKGEGKSLEREHGFEYIHRAAIFKDKSAEPFIVTAKYDPEEANKPVQVSTHDDQEFDYILKGKLRVTVDNYTTILAEGDSIYYNANLPHGMVAYDGDCEFIAVVIKNSKTLSEIKEVSAEEAEIENKEYKEIFHKFVTPTLDEKGRLTNLDFHPEDNFNFGYDVVDAIADKTPDKTAMVWLDNNKNERIFSFRDIKEQSNKTANFFKAQGIKKGDTVMVVLKRRYQFWYTMVALHKMGAVAVPASHQLTAHDYDYRFNTAKIKAVVMVGDEHMQTECEEALKISPTVEKLIQVGGVTRDGWVDFDSGIENQSSELQRMDTNINELMLMYFTSGTAGYPKIAAHTHKYALGHLVTAKYWHNVDRNGLHFTISDTGWGKSVWGKLYGQWLSEAAVFTYDFDKFKAEDILPLFAKYHITTFCAPPTMLRFFLLADINKYDLSSLKYVTTAGEALNREVFDQFYKTTGLKIKEGFGQTETTLTIANLVNNDIRLGSMGKPTPQYNVDIVDENGNTTKDGEVGEIVIRLDEGKPFGLFEGYYLNEESTAKAVRDGLYHTGDMAWRDEEGYYWYMSRIDDVIKSSGYRIGPFEIESVIMELPYVVECAITGVPDPIRGQVVKATIVLKDGVEGNDALKKDIQTYVKTHTAPYKYPRVIDFVKELPRTTNGKIRRVALRK
ncbi:MAG: AMP-binding protein [Clostridia bacterium]|nr:AMP-binding protein [Clostridia bacterium]